MAQDPEPEDDRDEVEEELTDDSHDLDMVTIYAAETAEAESEANVIRGVLDANGIPSVLVDSRIVPPVGVHVQVPRGLVAEAVRVIEEAQAAGPEAAAEAEAAGEKNQ
jgi:hypothetical protein